MQTDIDDPTTLTSFNVNHAFCHFLTKVRKVDGSPFPPHVLYEILVCLQFQLEMHGIMWKLLEDEHFTSIKFTLDNVMKMHCCQGYSTSVKQADVLLYEDENMLWQMGYLEYDNPTKLLNTLVYV